LAPNAFALLSGLSQGDSAQEIAEQILAATDGHSGAGTAPHDDRTLVVLRVTDDSSADFSKLPSSTDAYFVSLACADSSNWLPY